MAHWIIQCNNRKQKVAAEAEQQILTGTESDSSDVISDRIKEQELCALKIGIVETFDPD